MTSGFRAFFVAQCAVVSADVCEPDTWRDTWPDICPDYGNPAQHSDHPWASVAYSSFRHAKNCTKVADEIMARIAGTQDGSWTDPQTGGQYSLLDSCSFAGDISKYDTNRTGTIITAQRSASPFTDLVNFVMTDSDLSPDFRGGSCEMVACSAGQDTSVTAEALSRNYCNIHNLMCGSKEGCTSVLKDFRTGRPGEFRAQGNAEIEEYGNSFTCAPDCNAHNPYPRYKCDCWCPSRGDSGQCADRGELTADRKMCSASLESVV